ncbi:uncharacterized protein TNCV_4908921 [Trichonephila clavipes]|uniref:Uncharacterized protein n=1 Tax=Trichonephila clavipes TaxID=2585209 RepID=A0A8X6V9S3_TRICX|nr:uncharacterized protein TNCV_4908921 [Trichonephila clavipes]
MFTKNKRKLGKKKDLRGRERMMRLNNVDDLEESFRLTASRVARDKTWSTLCKKSHGIPSSPRAAAVAKFRLLTGHDCLCAHLFRFNLATSPICVLCDTGQDMTVAHLDECSALKDLNCIVKRITTSDETYIPFFDIPARQETKVWFEDDPTPTMIKGERATKKVMSTVFFRSTGLVKAIKLEGQMTITVNCDEAHFWLNGYVNKQNCRIWSEANSQVYVETPLHPEKLTVWCALWAGGILLQKR